MSRPSSRDPTDFYYPGFLHPTTTPVPDDVIDELMPRLSEAGLKVLLYIVRRTFGFRNPVVPDTEVRPTSTFRAGR